MCNDQHSLHMLWAARDWEHEQGVIDATGEENRQEFAQHPRLSADVAATFYQQLCAEVDEYVAFGVTLCSFVERTEIGIAPFEVRDYNELYRGHESGIRQLILRAASKPSEADLDEAALQGDERVRLLVAYYFAFTDWALETEDRRLYPVVPEEPRESAAKFFELIGSTRIAEPSALSCRQVTTLMKRYYRRDVSLDKDTFFHIKDHMSFCHRCLSEFAGTVMARPRPDEELPDHEVE